MSWLRIAGGVGSTLLLAFPSGAAQPTAQDDGLATILTEDVERHVWNLAAPELEGRDSPSAGLSRAADYIESVFRAAGLQGVGASSTFRLDFERQLLAPLIEGCALRYHAEEGGSARNFEYGKDFVPLPNCTGVAEGELTFVGFGIRAKKERYDDLKGKDVDGRVAVLIEGEPRHRKILEGPVVTPFADVHKKVEELEEEGAVAVLVVRRPLPTDRKRPLEIEPRTLSYRYTFASWVGEPDPKRQERTFRIPVLEVSNAAASALLGVDVEALAVRADKTGRFPKVKTPVGRVVVESSLEERMVAIENVCGLIPGSDPALQDEYVILGAHYDHIGVDPRGRIGDGADDNASGTAVILELAEALAAAPPRRSVLVCAFAAEEDGLLGSKAFCAEPPVPVTTMVAMLNFDMVGRGEDKEVALFGVKENPDLVDVVMDARKHARTGIKKIHEVNNRGLFERSDHFSFHQVGVPSIFFFEAENIADNEDYHTYRDTIAGVSFEKITNTARLAYLTAWLLAEDDDRPREPR